MHAIAFVVAADVDADTLVAAGIYETVFLIEVHRNLDEAAAVFGADDTPHAGRRAVAFQLFGQRAARHSAHHAIGD